MNKLQWTHSALADLNRLYEFLAAVNPVAAAHVVQSLTHAPERLLTHPRLGEKLNGFGPREIRRIIVGHYEVRYEIAERSAIVILRLWHTRENR